jgi:uncharacterized membrane protein YsdA (DUF1294 family)
VLRIIFATYAVMSIVTFFAYAIDKRRAVRERWRTAEATLHVMELLGGFPGAFVAQRLFNHKRSKRTYMIVYWLIVALHALIWISCWLIGNES